MTKDNTNEFPKSPYAKFSCLISPYIAWHHNLVFKECPVCSTERDMACCINCPLKGETYQKQKVKKERPVEVVKRPKEKIPTIKKTYSTE